MLDNLLNPGLLIWQGNSIWTHAWIDPTVAAFGLGALIQGFRAGWRKAVICAIVIFLSSLLIFRLWIGVLPADKLPALSANLFPNFFPLLHEAIVGLIAGAILGYFRGGRAKIGWHALAGMVGFPIGFLLMDLAGRAILAGSPSGQNLTYLVVGSPWFYLYLIVPALIQGVTFGISLDLAGIASERRKETRPIAGHGAKPSPLP